MPACAAVSANVQSSVLLLTRCINRSRTIYISRPPSLTEGEKKQQEQGKESEKKQKEV